MGLNKMFYKKIYLIFIWFPIIAIGSSSSSSRLSQISRFLPAPVEPNHQWSKSLLPNSPVVLRRQDSFLRSRHSSSTAGFVSPASLVVVTNLQKRFSPDFINNIRQFNSAALIPALVRDDFDDRLPLPFSPVYPLLLKQEIENLNRDQSFEKSPLWELAYGKNGMMQLFDGYVRVTVLPSLPAAHFTPQMFFEICNLLRSGKKVSGNEEILKLFKEQFIAQKGKSPKTDMVKKCEKLLSSIDSAHEKTGDNTVMALVCLAAYLKDHEGSATQDFFEDIKNEPSSLGFGRDFLCKIRTEIAKKSWNQPNAIKRVDRLFNAVTAARGYVPPNIFYRNRNVAKVFYGLLNYEASPFEPNMPPDSRLAPTVLHNQQVVEKLSPAPDCGEKSLRQFIEYLCWYNYKFDPDSCLPRHITLSDQIRSALSVEDNASKPQLFMNAVSGLPNIEYLRDNYELKTTVDNFFYLLKNHLLQGVPESVSTFEELGKALSSDNMTVELTTQRGKSIHLGKQVIDQICVKITKKDAFGKPASVSSSWNILPSLHAQFEPDRPPVPHQMAVFAEEAIKTDFGKDGLKKIPDRRLIPKDIEKSDLLVRFALQHLDMQTVWKMFPKPTPLFAEELIKSIKLPENSFPFLGHLACLPESVGYAQALMRFNISNINARMYVRGNNNEEIPTSLIHLAAINNNVPFLEMLLNYKADANLVTTDELYVPIMMAGSLDVLDMLLSKGGADINKKDKRGFNALSCMIVRRAVAIKQKKEKDQYELFSMSQYLLDKGINKNEQDEEGKTPLMHAIHLKDKEMIWLLLKSGADYTTLKNKDGKTAFDLANEYSIHVDLFMKHLELDYKTRKQSLTN